VPRAAKVWHLLPHERGAIERLAGALRLSPIVAQLLLNRGLAEPDSARRFLGAPLQDLHPPATLPGVTAAAEQLHAAVTHNRRICVYGDYDVDGITGTAILWQVLRLMGATVEYYVPHRLEEGYGLNAETLRQLAAKGNQVIVTVDCGIAALAEADEARQLGIDLIVTDHHEMKEELPNAAVLVHPRLPGSGYPFAGLSGAGVAFKLAWALAQKACGSEKVTPRYRDFLMDSVALAALGLVADVMPLQDENRIFVRHGLRRLLQAPTVGLKALMEVAGLGDKPRLFAEDVAFKLAPRLNAAGRLGWAWQVVELLTTTSAQRALDLARYLEEQNQERQRVERRILSQARELAVEYEEAAALVLASEEWHPGVIGIVAGRLVEYYARPVLLIALTRPRTMATASLIGQGSGRSVPGFALHKALNECGDLLLAHGGHAMAAGFKLPADRVDSFRERFCAGAARRFSSGPPTPRLELDAEVPLSALTVGLLQDIDRLEPYGSANRRPLFLAGGVEVVGEPSRIGRGELHLAFKVRQERTTLRAIAFGMSERVEELMSAGGRCCLAFTPRLNEWNGRRNVEMEVVDWQPGPRAELV
jgi:single-stranded-DNA-specific exonuclease